MGEISLDLFFGAQHLLFCKNGLVDGGVLVNAYLAESRVSHCLCFLESIENGGLSLQVSFIDGFYCCGVLTDFLRHYNLNYL